MTRLSLRTALTLAALSVCSTPGWAQRITLREGGAVSGEVVQVQDDQVIIAVPRQAVASVDGRPLPPALNEGVAAPAFTAADLDGASHSVGSKQASVTVLHFWVQWCPHCRSDAPMLQTLHDQFRDDPKVKILTVNLDREQAKVQEFMKTRRVTYPVIMAALAEAAGGPNIPELYQVTAFPVTYVIDGQGIIRYKARGSFVETGQDLEALIRRLAAS